MATEADTARRPINLGLYTPSQLVQTAFGILLVGLLFFWIVVNFVKFPADSTQVLLIGATTGAIYALVALGYTLVYGILELINFAHGDVFMLGGMVSATVAGTVFGLTSGQSGVVVWLSVFGTLVIAMAFCGTLNASIVFVAFR